MKVPNKIFEFVAGSHAYGLATPESDKDIRGIFIAPLDNFFTLFNTSYVGHGTVTNSLLNKIKEHCATESYKSIEEIVDKLLETDNGDFKISNELMSEHSYLFY
jgi:hypothetical protein